MLQDLFRCSKELHKQSLGEVFISLFFSSLSLILGFVVLILTSKATLTDFESYSNLFFESIYSNIKNGEIILLSFSLVTPVFHIVLADHKDKQRFPNQRLHMCFFILLLAISITFFVLSRLGIQLNMILLLILSFFMLITSTLHIYITLVLDKSRLPPPELIKRGENQFAQKYRAHRQ